MQYNGIIYQRKKTKQFLLFLLHNLILLFQKNQTKFNTVFCYENFKQKLSNKSFSKLYLMIHQILTLKTFGMFIKHILQNLFQLSSDNSSHLKMNLLERIQKLMTGDDEIKDEKIQYNINRETAKKSLVKLIR